MKKVLGILLVVVLVLLGYIATRPNTYRIERSITIKAPSDVVFRNVNDLHKWESWSPWEKLDPQMKRTYDGPDAGVGSQYAWSGNDKVGEGRMTISESLPNERVGIQLEFLKPWKSTSVAQFSFVPIPPDDTKVVWVMEGKNDFMGKAMGLFMNMDKMVGGDFEKGLASLKAVSESQAAGASSSQLDSTSTTPTAH